jgi:hypothetical protein
MSLPPLVTNFVDVDIELVLQSENGILGTGSVPLGLGPGSDLINDGKETAQLRSRPSGLVKRRDPYPSLGWEGCGSGEPVPTDRGSGASCVTSTPTCCCTGKVMNDRGRT